MTATLPKVFISYRRSDSLAATGRLYDRLNAAYPGMFFRDVSGIGVGVDFTKEIERAISSSVTLIAVIGPTWATEAVDGKRRLDDPDDFVRLEVLNALKRGIRIIPVLVGSASMPEEDQLPPELHPFRKWNAIRLVEEYYEEGLERLIDALASQLGTPRTQESVDQAEAQRKLKQLRGEAEAALAVEDWFAGIQALQAAVSLDPGNSDLSARLRWAHDQQRALARRATVRRWTAGTVAAVVVAIVGAGALLVLLIRSDFAGNTGTSEIDPAIADSLRTLLDQPSDQPATGGASPRPANEPAAAPAQRLVPDAVAPAQRATGVGFPGRGRWRMTARENQAMAIALDLENDGSFAVSMPAGVLNLPLSGGRYAYDDSTGMLEIMGVNNLGAVFRETIHVFEREDDHFHANYLGTVWELEGD
jgi:TIR domain